MKYKTGDKVYLTKEGKDYLRKLVGEEGVTGDLSGVGKVQAWMPMGFTEIYQVDFDDLKWDNGQAMVLTEYMLRGENEQEVVDNGSFVVPAYKVRIGDTIADYNGETFEVAQIDNVGDEPERIEFSRWNGGDLSSGDGLAEHVATVKISVYKRRYK